MTFPKRRPRAPLVLANSHSGTPPRTRTSRPAGAPPARRAAGTKPRRTSVCYRCLYSGPATQATCPSCGFALITAERTVTGANTLESLMARSDDRVHLPGVHPATRLHRNG